MAALEFGGLIAPDLNHTSTTPLGGLDNSIAQYVQDAGSNPARARLQTTDEATEFQPIAGPKAGPHRPDSRARVSRSVL